MNLRFIMGITFILLIIMMSLYVYYFRKVSDSFVDVGRCGVDIPSCSDGLRCMNGYCKSDIPTHLPKLSDLPIRPPRYPYSS
jgi:hypothetical protein